MNAVFAFAKPALVILCACLLVKKSEKHEMLQRLLVIAGSLALAAFAIFTAWTVFEAIFKG